MAKASAKGLGGCAVLPWRDGNRMIAKPDTRAARWKPMATFEIQTGPTRAG